MSEMTEAHYVAHSQRLFEEMAARIRKHAADVALADGANADELRAIRKEVDAMLHAGRFELMGEILDLIAQDEPQD